MSANKAPEDPAAMESNSDSSFHPGELARELRHLVLGLKLCGITDLMRRPGDRPAAPDTEPPADQKTEPPPADSVRHAALRDIQQELGDCRRCRLHQGRHNLVFGDGSATAPLVFVGEGPGEDEDRQGKPFVGKAGKLLDQMIRAMGLKRSDVYICNVVKCRPPGNRTPQEDEIATCSPFLFKQLEAIRPKVICALGACAAQTLTQKRLAVGRLRKSVHFWHGIPLVVTYHPAYLLRSPAQKAAVWQDLLEVLKLLE
jgi:uracil-DNA glycosylase family 4